MLDWPIQKAVIFTLILIRTSGIMVFAPFLGSRQYPLQMKAAVALILAFLAFSTMQGARLESYETYRLLAAAASEFAVGLIIGYAASTLFVGVQMAGEIVGQQMGFALVNVLDPLSEEEVSLIGEMKFFMAIAIFLAIDGHHFLLRAVVSSFQVVSLGGAHLGEPVVISLARLSAGIFVVAVKVAAPTVLVLFLVSVALGFVARTVPQMNVFIVGFPLTVGVGLAVLLLATPFFATMVQKLWIGMEMSLSDLIYQVSS